MDVEQKSEFSAPFQEECNTAHFFIGGGRGAILHDIQVALTNRVDLITLIGEEGSGKTMLCKMLQEQQDTKHKILFLPQIVESFEDVVRIAAQECELSYPADATRTDAKKIFLDLLAALRSRGESLVLVCDEAEKMYLATLERIRKILDDVKVEGGGLQVLLAGRKSLGGHLEQLALCDFDQITEKQFFLSALDDNETWNYLNFCVQAHRGTDQQEVFTKEAADKIASMGRGNLRMINMYAEESLRSSNADTSFLVLLDHVKDDGSGEDLLAPTPGTLSQLPFPPQYIIGGLAALGLLLLIFVFRGDDEKKVPELVLQQESSVVFTQPRVEAETVVQEVQEEEVVTAGAVRGALEKPVLKTEVVDEVVAVVAPDIPEPERDLEPIHVQEIELVETGKETRSVSSILPAAVMSTPVEISPVEIVEKTAVEPEKLALTTPPVISAEKIKRILLPRIESSQGKKIPVKTVSSSFGGVPVFETPKDPALASLITAGEKWLAGEMDSSFSIQLMVLKSDQAEENLKRIISQPEYQDVADKLVMLKRPSDPPLVLLFYGVYPSMATARNARNNMPIFLRDRHPYPVSVRGAVEKARAE